MSSATRPTPAGIPVPPAPSVRALRAEVRNMHSTPTARALLVGSVVMAIASCVANLSVVEADRLNSPDTLQLAMHASTVATLVFALLAGVISSTSDFRYGRIDQLLLSEPNRPRLFMVKAAVGSFTGMIYGTLGAVAAVLAISSYFAYRETSVDLTSPVVMQPIFGVIVGAALFAAIGIGVGTAVKNQPAAVAGSLAVMLIVEPTLLLGLPTVGKWLPGAAGLALTNSPDPNLFSQPNGGLLLLAWTSVAFFAGRHRIQRSDL